MNKCDQQIGPTFPAYSLVCSLFVFVIVFAVAFSNVKIQIKFTHLSIQKIAFNQDRGFRNFVALWIGVQIVSMAFLPPKVV